MCTLVSSKRQKDESVWHFSGSSLFICRLYRTCILRETSTKPQGMLTHLWLSSLIAFFCWPSFLWTAISSQRSSSIRLCQLTLSVSSGTFLPSSTSCFARDIVLSPFCGFCAKTDKEIICVMPTQTETDCYTLCHTVLIYLYIYTYGQHFFIDTYLIKYYRQFCLHIFLLFLSSFRIDFMISGEN